MIKKIMIEQEDKNKLLNLGPERLDNIMKLVEEYTNEPEQKYVIGFDIAGANSKNKSVMVKFRVVGDNYIYEGCEEIWLNSKMVAKLNVYLHLIIYVVNVSELIGFYCMVCDGVHVDYLIKNIRWIDNNMVCKEGYERIWKETGFFVKIVMCIINH